VLSGSACWLTGVSAPACARDCGFASHVYHFVFLLHLTFRFITDISFFFLRFTFKLTTVFTNFFSWVDSVRVQHSAL